MDVNVQRIHFHWIDWVVFVSMLSLSAAAGLWHFKRAQMSNTAEFMLGKSMRLFPVSASLIASFISGVTIVGTPAEVYNFGTQYWLTIVSILFSGIIVINVFLPVFATLKLNSVYEYLEIRFSKSVRILISFIFVIDVILYQSIVVYVPALALNQVSDVNIYVTGAVICSICVFYTVLGGLRAVVWADSLQVLVMIIALTTVTVLGTYRLGGPMEVWKKAEEANRIEFTNFDFSPYTRHTVWTVLFGSWLYTTAYISVNQTMVQRYISLVNIKTSRIAIMIFTIGVMCFISVCCWCGLVLVAWWSPPKCDPRASGVITTDDQLLPAFVVEIAKNLRGVPGLFISGIFGAALSTLSVGLNSTSVVIYEDFMKSCFGMKLKDTRATVLVKSIIVLLGTLALSLIYLIQKFGGVLAMTGSLAAIAAGTSFGVFSLGILFPWTNSKGAFVGAIAGFLVAGWASFGANMSIATGAIIPRKIPVDTSYCENVTREFSKQFEYRNEEDVFPLYRLSYHWDAGLGLFIVIIVGLTVSWLTGNKDVNSVDRSLLSPVIHRWLPRQQNDDRLSIGNNTQEPIIDIPLNDYDNQSKSSIS